MPVAPTHSNLMKLKEKLDISQEGYDLLDEKREVMIMELMDNIHGYKDLEERVTEKLKKAYRALESAYISNGEKKLRQFTSRDKEPDINVKMRSIMGIPVPDLSVDVPEKQSIYSLASTDENFDRAVKNFREVIEIIVRWAAREILIWRLGQEINKTQKRVNALENIFIPDYKEKIKKIEESLEEEEREEFFRRKRLKGRV